MFDDLNQKPQENDTNLGGQPGVQAESAPASGQAGPAKAGVEDMFAETEPVKPAQFQPKESGTQAAEEPVEQGGRSMLRIQKILTLVAIMCVILLLVIGAYWGIKWWMGTEQPDAMLVGNNQDPEEEGAAEPGGPTVIPADDKLPGPTPAQTVAESDSDQDGLSDDRERLLGTNPHHKDTDNDGLFDREEVESYGTDPLNPDTDNDGYEDGEEVRANYNPKGEGKLYSIN